MQIPDSSTIYLDFQMMKDNGKLCSSHSQQQISVYQINLEAWLIASDDASISH